MQASISLQIIKYRDNLSQESMNQGEQDNIKKLIFNVS